MTTSIEAEKDLLVTPNDVKEYLGIDYDDDYSKKNIDKFIKTVESTLKGAINNFDKLKKDDRAKQLALFIIEELYDRETSSSFKENASREKLKATLMLQLQCEGRDMNG